MSIRAFEPVTGYQLFLVNLYYQMGWSNVTIEMIFEAARWASEFEATMALAYCALTDHTNPFEDAACREISASVDIRAIGE
jgi:hypothetical protein